MNASGSPYNQKRANAFFFSRFSEVLNADEMPFSEREIRTLIKECGLDATRALHLLYAALFGLDGEEEAVRALVGDYFVHMLHVLDPAPYRRDGYLKTIRFPEIENETWEMRRQSYKPFDLFVFDDPLILPDGRVIPQIGCFDSSFEYPAVLENGREWMTVTPNEINTMKSAIGESRGHIVSFGLGLGYFAFHTSEKETVEKVTVVERDRRVIELFCEYLLPQFPHREKIEIIRADAFDFAKHTLPALGANTAFVDLWHDAADGVDLRRRMRALAPLSPNTHFSYWIDKTLDLYE